MSRAITTKSGVGLVVAMDCAWATETAEGTIKLDQDKALCSVLPLLEQEPKETMEHLNKFAATEKLPPFPTESLILHALLHSSAYWKEFAIRWITSLDIRNDKIDSQLMQIQKTGSGWPQNLRHRVKKLLSQRAKH